MRGTKRRQATVGEPDVEATAKRAKAPVGEERGENDAEAEEQESGSPIHTKPRNTPRAPVNDSCPIRATHHVYVDAAGVIFDAALNQVNIDDNNNKFYNVQLLESDRSPYKYACWTQWGRVGEAGANTLVEHPEITGPMQLFRKKFKEKTGLTWEQRMEPPRPKKYTVIEKDYADSDMEEGPTGQTNEPPSTLPEKVQDLVAFIFSTEHMEKTMLELRFNAAKLPLGKLSKHTIEAGYLALKDLGDIITTPSLTDTKYDGRPFLEVCKDLTSRYYTVIPHDFGRSRPPTIATEEGIKREITLIQTLEDLAIAYTIAENAKVTTDSLGNRVNTLDQQFAGLGLEEVVALEHESSEYLKLEHYFFQSHPDSPPIRIEDIFRISRKGETERFSAGGFDGPAMKQHPGGVGDARKLLWHGSSSSNFGGILSQGLRIAPPEAPCNGYSMGKGIYLADESKLSWNFTSYEATGDTGLLLLCEAQVGDRVYEVESHDSNAAEKAAATGCLSALYKAWEGWEWADGGAVDERLQCVEMPAAAARESVGTRNGYGHNEYVVYKEAQVRMRYLVRAKHLL